MGAAALLRAPALRLLSLLARACLLGYPPRRRGLVLPALGVAALSDALAPRCLLRCTADPHQRALGRLLLDVPAAGMAALRALAIRLPRPQSSADRLLHRSPGRLWLGYPAACMAARCARALRPPLCLLAQSAPHQAEVGVTKQRPRQTGQAPHRHRPLPQPRGLALGRLLAVRLWYHAAVETHTPRGQNQESSPHRLLPLPVPPPLRALPY